MIFFPDASGCYQLDEILAHGLLLNKLKITKQTNHEYQKKILTEKGETK
jgi:hypothetical protein